LLFVGRRTYGGRPLIVEKVLVLLDSADPLVPLARLGDGEVAMCIPGLGIGPGIVDSNLELQVRGIGTLITLGHMQLLGMWMAGSIEPSLVIESDRVYDQRVSFPMAPRVTVIRGLQVVCRMATPVHEDLPVAVHVTLKQENNQLGGLDDLIRKGILAWYTIR